MNKLTSPRIALTSVLVFLLLFGGTSSVGAADLKAVDLNAVAIGDSVMLGAKSQLQQAGVGLVDAKVSRQASSGPELVRKLAGKSDVQHVVIHLGTNGYFTVESCRDMVKAAGLKRTVYLINLKVPRKWESNNNALIAQCAKGFSSTRVRVLDWNNISQSKDSYLYSDGIHLTPVGAKKFARMISGAIKESNAWQGRVTPGTR